VTVERNAQDDGRPKGPQGAYRRHARCRRDLRGDWHCFRDPAGRAGALYRRGLKAVEPRMSLTEVTVSTSIADLPIGKDACAALLPYGFPLAELIHHGRYALQSELLRLPGCNRRKLMEVEAVQDDCLANAVR
jgi:hypothetical protein